MVAELDRGWVIAQEGTQLNTMRSMKLKMPLLLVRG
jgi:hypothetical protein